MNIYVKRIDEIQLKQQLKSVRPTQMVAEYPIIIV